VGQDDDNDNEDYYWDDDDMGSTGWGLCPSTPGTTNSAAVAEGSLVFLRYLY